MRLFEYEIIMSINYPFGDGDYYTLKDLIQVNDMSLSDKEIKKKLIKKLNLSTKHKEEPGHSYLTQIKLRPILSF